MQHTVLLIDDDIDDCEFFEIALAQTTEDYIFFPVNTSLSAIDQLTKGEIKPDVIFLDLNIPLCSGKECLDIIRRTPGLEAIRVVIFTTSSYYKDIEETRELGASHFLSKTPDIDSLSVLLKKILLKDPLPYTLN